MYSQIIYELYFVYKIYSIETVPSVCGQLCVSDVEDVGSIRPSGTEEPPGNLQYTYRKHCGYIQYPLRDLSGITETDTKEGFLRI